DALECFHQYREIFCTKISLTSSLPWQHSMKHYLDLIHLFGAPNGHCSSITKSKHIKAMKEPYQRSYHHNALGQMLLTNQRLDKLARSQVDFHDCGMLNGSCVSAVLQALG
ncbi:hypothetical protein PAXRUDRAFT_42648, partial [Paxillus rubicundulus Ve08.2h10]